MQISYGRVCVLTPVIPIGTLYTTYFILMLFS